MPLKMRKTAIFINLKKTEAYKIELGGVEMEPYVFSNVLAYIEENLENELNIPALARAAGYSPWHFLRKFRETFGFTPADYLRKRRLSKIARRMVEEKRPISELAFAYGFNSKENFIRAFKREHHILPTEYRDARCSLRLYPPWDKAQQVQPELRFTMLDSFQVVAYKSDETYPPHFHNRYNAGGYSKKLSGDTDTMDFAVSVWDAVQQRLRYYIGVRDSDAHGNPDGTEKLVIPAGLYAVFKTPPATQFDFVDTIRRTWAYIRDTWLPENGYGRSGGPEFECYQETSRTFTEEIYIPVERQGERKETE